MSSTKGKTTGQGTGREQSETSITEHPNFCTTECQTPLYFLYLQSYLSEKGLVHRDLAARNILVGHGKRLKIGDFGLMRQLYREVYEVQKQKKLPIKWMAPESIFEETFTVKSDV